MTFEKNKYEVVNNAISKEHARQCAIEFQMHYEYLHHITKGEINDTQGDGQVPMFSYTSYAPYFGEALLVLLKPRIEQVVNKKLFPCYSYARIYFPGATMKIHTDRPSCEFSATLTLDVDGEVWPIYFLDLKKKRKELILDVGTMVVYKGDELEHWRSTMNGKITKTQTQVFLHYVDANGPNKDHIYDKRPFLGFPAEFKRE